MNLSSPDAAIQLTDLDVAAAAYLQATGQRPDGATLTADLLAVERRAKRQRPTVLPEQFYGTWRLCFTAPNKPNYRAGKPMGRGLYLPRWVQAAISIGPGCDDTTPLLIQNQLQVGPFCLGFDGPARFQANQNLLVFNFTRLQICLFGKEVFQTVVGRGATEGEPFCQTPVAKLPFFAFFAVTDTIMAARGRGGGLALWAKLPEPARVLG